jgi:DNA-binding beta-propeller fold protein YncE
VPHFSALAFGDGRLWIVDRAQNRLVEVDPATSQQLRQTSVGNEPVAAAVGFGSVWIANNGNATVSRVDLGTGGTPEVRTIAVGDRPVDVAVGEGAVWVANEADRSISRIDPKGNRVTDTVRLAAGSGHVWVTVRGS